MRNVIRAIAILAEIETHTSQKKDRFVLNRIKQQFENEGVFLGKGGKSNQKECLEKACSSLGVKKKEKRKALDELENQHHNLPKTLPKAACSAAILLEHSKESTNKVSQALGVPEEVTQKAYKRIYQKSPPQQKGKRPAQKKKSGKGSVQPNSLTNKILRALKTPRNFPELHPLILGQHSKPSIRGRVYELEKQGRVEKLKDGRYVKK